MSTNEVLGSPTDPYLDPPSGMATIESSPRFVEGTGKDMTKHYPYVDALRAVQASIVADARTVRSMLEHRGEIGSGVEDVFAHALRQLLPRHVGVTKGFVIDSCGAMSKQMDIILYNENTALNVPLPEAAFPKGTRVLPVESTYACCEVKTSLDAAKLKDAIVKKDSYKKLQRRAYRPDASIVRHTYLMYGEEKEHLQSMFFTLCIESVDMAGLVDVLNEDQASRPYEGYMDGVFSMDCTKENSLIYPKLQEEPPVARLELLCETGCRLAPYRAVSPLALFVLLLMRYLQARPENVDMMSYWRGGI
ncbi:MAG: hypothetical protein OXF79_30935 [Chloroflexi bacterium]|nr:hypothetical protein [Chloroflexota bacterium]